VKNQRVSCGNPTAKSQRKGKRKAPLPSTDGRTIAVYDGHCFLGKAVGTKAGGFNAVHSTGRRLGHFATVKAAADCVSASSLQGGAL